MQSPPLEISALLGQIKDVSPAGYALGFHIHYTTPKFMFQTYSKDWLDYYSQNGLVMADPMVAWGFENDGFCHWSDLHDPSGVMVKAAEYGMKYGVVISNGDGGSRSIGGFARADRAFDDAELKLLSSIFGKIHDETADQAQLSTETVQQLKKMSVMVTHPGG